MFYILNIETDLLSLAFYILCKVVLHRLFHPDSHCPLYEKASCSCADPYIITMATDVDTLAIDQTVSEPKDQISSIATESVESQSCKTQFENQIGFECSANKA